MDSARENLEGAKALSKSASETLSKAEQRAAAARRGLDDARRELERAEADLQRARNESDAAEIQLKRAEEEHARRSERERKTKSEEKREATCEARSEVKRAQPAVRDVSPLLFDGDGRRLPFDLPYIGPVSISTSVVHGRGLVASRDVEAGECLFITRPILSAAVSSCRERFNRHPRCTSKCEPSYAEEVERFAEKGLLDGLSCLQERILGDEELQTGENLDRARRMLSAFRAQMSSSDTAPAVSEMDVLLATGDRPISFDTSRDYIEEEEALSIIRRNAFGPDFHNFDAIARRWTQTWPQEECCYNRILSVYPLAAMINHSCCPNAVRVFGTVPKSERGTTAIDEECTGDDVMIVHASTKISRGDEIVWSYIPPCGPVEQRRQMLKKYGFVCECDRCAKELEVAGRLIPTLEALDDRKTLIERLELALSSSGIPNECQRLLRVGYSTMYIDYFNATLRSMPKSDRGKVSDLLKLATQLHFSFVQCNKACTEHISILHLCYELVSITHMNARDGGERTKTTNQIRFWTEQLKRAHMVRYGELGQNLELVRKAMKHTQLVLRSDDGFFRVGCKFI